VLNFEIRPIRPNSNAGRRLIKIHFAPRFNVLIGSPCHHSTPPQRCGLRANVKASDGRPSMWQHLLSAQAPDTAQRHFLRKTQNVCSAQFRRVVRNLCSAFFLHCVFLAASCGNSAPNQRNVTQTADSVQNFCDALRKICAACEISAMQFVRVCV